MGLDIYFNKTTKEMFQTAKSTNNFSTIKETEMAYFRKVNCLLPFFGYEDNISYLAIEKCQIEDLLKTAKELLEVYVSIDEQLQLHKKDLQTYKGDKKTTKLIQQKIDNLWEEFATIAKEKLPTTTGFFFGYTEYRDYYIADLMDIVEMFTKIIDETDFDTEQIYMYCWW